MGPLFSSLLFSSLLFSSLLSSSLSSLLFSSLLFSSLLFSSLLFSSLLSSSLFTISSPFPDIRGCHLGNFFPSSISLYAHVSGIHFRFFKLSEDKIVQSGTIFSLF